ncbi:MAG: ATP-binding protein, partial [Gammaproteobacteria bacterium]|nr:ATP-binding protein [Gammaproteobacteria bacterium]
YARLDRSDQIRIELIDQSGAIKRYALLNESPGNVSVYEMHESWIRPVTGKPVYQLSAIWRDVANGYDVEFRLPIDWLNDDRQLLISVADVNSDVERNVDNVVATLADDMTGYLNRLIIRSPELDRILKGLGYADSNVCIVDQFRRVRALLGDNSSQSQLCSSTDRVTSDLVSQTLAGQSSVYRNTLEIGDSLVVASHPIYQESDIIGAVLVEKNSNNILAQQRESLDKLIVATVIVFFIALAGLLLFSSRLAYRIRSLQREVSTAVDTNGRLIKESVSASKYSGDEIGELSRGVSSLLSQLKSYTGFLESVPRTLRHEILNPLNTISMSLQKMDADSQFDQKTIDGANRALRQLELIVHSLTEAAHIDDALSQDEREVFDLAELLSEYLSNIKERHLDNHFNYIGMASGVLIEGSDLRITQLLDKLKDNAIDFSDRGSEITFELSLLSSEQLCLTICNFGSLIPNNILANLTHGILSHRHGASGEPHLGIGLYVASRIATYHNGSLEIINRPEGDGVCVSIFLPTTAGND